MRGGVKREANLRIFVFVWRNVSIFGEWGEKMLSPSIFTKETIVPYLSFPKRRFRLVTI